MESVDVLGLAIERAWQAAEYDPRHFSDIACRALSEARLPDSLTIEDVVAWTLAAPTLPPQPDPTAKFGQPPVTVFRGRRFYVDVLFWIDGSTSVHQHAFSGAFQVLAGSSIETRFAFERTRAFDGHFVIGALTPTATSLLVRGDIRPIDAGPGGLIHSLFHLDRPSATIVARTVRDPGAGPQFDFSWPGVGCDPFFSDEARDRAMQLVTMLRHIEHPGLEQQVGDLIARSDLHTAFRLLRECLPLADRAVFDRLVDRVRDREAVDLFHAAFRETRRLTFLLSRRNVVKQPDLRFFLGVLLNAHRRQDVLELVRARAPDVAPARQVASWVRALSNVTLKLQAAGAPWQPSLLGIPELTDEHERALADVLAGAPRPTDDATALFLARLRELPALGSLFA